LLVIDHTAAETFTPDDAEGWTVAVLSNLPYSGIGKSYKVKLRTHAAMPHGGCSSGCGHSLENFTWLREQPVSWRPQQAFDELRRLQPAHHV
jgi:hypothetical protein